MESEFPKTRAENLKEVIIDESIKAYDEFTDAVDLVNGEEWTSKTSAKVDKHMDNLSDIVTALQSMHCE